MERTFLECELNSSPTVSLIQNFFTDIRNRINPLKTQSNFDFLDKNKAKVEDFILERRQVHGDGLTFGGVSCS